jgi:hypothetical protein
MELQGDMGQVEARFGLLGGDVNIGVRLVHGLCQMYHGHGNIFWLHSMDLLGDVGQMEACFGLFGDNVNLHAR